MPIDLKMKRSISVTYIMHLIQYIIILRQSIGRCKIFMQCAFVLCVYGTLLYAYNSGRTDDAEKTLFRHPAGYIVTGGGGGISLSFSVLTLHRAIGDASAAAPINGPLISALRRAAFAECLLARRADHTKTRAVSSLVQRIKMCSRHTVVTA